MIIIAAMTSRALSPRDRYRLIAGSTFRLTLTAGNQLRIETSNGTLPAAENPDAATRAQTLVAAADGEVEVELSTPAQYYLAWMASVDAGVWFAAGVIDVLPIADDREKRLRDEIAFLDDRVSNAEAVMYQASGPDGSSYMKSNLAQLRRHRANAEARLEDYLRRRGRRPPATLRA